jgi:hypothetical protein
VRWENVKIALKWSIRENEKYADVSGLRKKSLKNLKKCKKIRKAFNKNYEKSFNSFS